MSLQIWVVIDKRGELVGAFATYKAACVASAAHSYFCDIKPTEIQGEATATAASPGRTAACPGCLRDGAFNPKATCAKHGGNHGQ